MTKTSKPLTEAQIDLLKLVGEHGHWHDHVLTDRTAKALIKRGLIVSEIQGDGVQRWCTYTITSLGRNTLATLTPDQPAITVHLNADATLRPETAAALDTLIQIAVEAMEADAVVFDEDDTVEPTDSAIVAAEVAPVLSSPLDFCVAQLFTVGNPLADAANTIHFDPPLLFSSAPLTAEQQCLLELAEGIADGVESGDIVLVDEQRDHDEAMNAVMLLTFEEAEFMEKVCRFDGLVVKPWDDDALDMAAHLEQGKLVTIDRSQVGYVIVSAVRPDASEE